MRLPSGKVPPEVLEKIVFRGLGVHSEDVILGPALGEDGAAFKVGDEIVISSMDPITGAIERIGWLAVNINANDIATFGVKPKFFSSCILLPETETASDDLEKICNQMDLAARRLEISIIGGHSEVTPGIEHSIVIGCALGIAKEGRYVTSGGAEAGDHLILTKGAGIEGTAILASEKKEKLMKKFGNKLVESAEKFYEMISVVDDALTAFNVGGVTAMHDPTEGGVAGGIHEIADASNLGVKIFEDKIHIAEETYKICSFFRIDPLQLIGSGALLIAVKPQYSNAVVDALHNKGIEASIIGQFLEEKEKRLMIKCDGETIELVRPVSDHLWKALKV
ncbi:TPA: hydrogenase [Candidatus Bathyarchaeota archaeon]|nr:hydrogenase [Candidatus Bathyarchaeota archaeon]